MKLHKAQRLFGDYKWLRDIVYDFAAIKVLSTSSMTFEDWIEQVLFSICFRPFEKLNMDAKQISHEDTLDYGGRETRETVSLRVEYILVCNMEGYCDEYWHTGFVEKRISPEDTIGATITRVAKRNEKCYPDKKMHYTAIVRRKSIASAFGFTVGFDIFPFPDGWHPSVASL